MRVSEAVQDILSDPRSNTAIIAVMPLNQLLNLSDSSDYEKLLDYYNGVAGVTYSKEMGDLERELIRFEGAVVLSTGYIYSLKSAEEVLESASAPHCHFSGEELKAGCIIQLSQLDRAISRLKASKLQVRDRHSAGVDRGDRGREYTSSHAAAAPQESSAARGRERSRSRERTSHAAAPQDSYAARGGDEDRGRARYAGSQAPQSFSAPTNEGRYYPQALTTARAVPYIHPLSQRQASMPAQRVALATGLLYAARAFVGSSLENHGVTLGQTDGINMDDYIGSRQATAAAVAFAAPVAAAAPAAVAVAAGSSPMAGTGAARAEASLAVPQRSAPSLSAHRLMPAPRPAEEGPSLHTGLSLAVDELALGRSTSKRS